MNTRIAGVRFIAAAVIVTFITVPPRVMQPTREEMLIEAFPQLARRFAGPAGMPASGGGVATAMLIPDPFLRSASKTSADFAYDLALRRLLAAQVDLRKQEERLFDLHASAGTAETQSRLDDARRRRDIAEQAAETASRARDERSGPLTGAPGYRGILVQRNTIVLRFRDDVGVEAIRDFLDRQQFLIRSGVASIGLFVVEMAGAEPEPTLDGDATRLRAVVNLLKEQRDLVDSAVQNSLLGPHIVPRPAQVQTQPKARYWFSASPPRDPLVLSHFPEAWNFNQAIAVRRGHVNVGVLDIGFRKDICQQNDCDLVITATCSNTEDSHGTAVASVIGATFGDGLGMDGASPFVSLFGCAPDDPPPCDAKVSDCSDLTNKGKLFSGFIKALPTLIVNSRARVVNASIGYNWSNFVDLDPLKNSDVQAIVANQGKDVRMLLKYYDDTILVASAGNDSARASGIIEPAVWASPFNWAALYGAPADYSPNVIVVEALHQDRATDQLTPRDDSNDGGAIAAIGDDVLSIVLKDTYDGLQGTSAAAPLVSATIALMLSNNSTLKVDQIKAALDLGPGKQLNAFKAMCASAADHDIELADLTCDGKVDMADFLIFKSGYQQISKHQITDDLNMDGVCDANDSMFCRIDLDGNGKVEAADLEVMIRAWNGGLSPDDAKRLRLLLEQ